ncbi:unnamed protein product, partial [Rotaria magnacalcarata]
MKYIDYSMIDVATISSIQRTSRGLYDMKELSDQITLICSTYFRAITSQELLYR